MPGKAFDWRNANRRGLLVAAFLVLGGAAGVAFPASGVIPTYMGHFGARGGSVPMRLEASHAPWAGGTCIVLGLIVAAASAYVPRAFRHGRLPGKRPSRTR